MKTRKIKDLHQNDFIETYQEIIEGQCNCGEKVNRVVGSNCTNYANGDRYYYPDSDTLWNIFRCRNCSSVILESFTSTSHNSNYTATQDKPASPKPTS